jgi:hypothetical protein
MDNFEKAPVRKLLPQVQEGGLFRIFFARSFNPGDDHFIVIRHDPPIEKKERGVKGEALDSLKLLREVQRSSWLRL